MEEYKQVLKKYAVFEGRAARKEFWMFVLFSTIISIILSILDSVLGLREVHGNGPLQGIYMLVIIVPSLAVGARRLHDVGKSGWLQLIGIIPLLGALVLLYFCVKDSMPGDNKYGPNPKGMNAAPEVTVVQS